MSWDEVVDFAKAVHEEIGRYAVQSIILNPDRLLNEDFVVPNLEWQTIQFETGDIQQVPDDKRGIYAFAVRLESQVLPPHGYILYMGMAGRRSSRSLRERYQDYLYPKRVLKRGGVAVMMGNWRQVLQFIFSPVDDSVSTEDLQLLEVQLNTALIPPYSEQDIEADVRAKRRAWR